MKLVNYDTYKYDYKTYWDNRAYEDEAEKIALEKMLGNISGGWFLDIGGSFGRNLPRYYNRYTHPIIIDYSLETLIKYQPTITKQFPNTILIAANAYKLPFRNAVFDGGLMVRVLHHIEKPNDYFKEVSRILNSRSLYVQEFANKVHLKARIRSLLRLDFSIFNLEPYQQPNQGYNEGTKGEATTFLNFHPQYIKELMNSQGFVVTQKIGASYLRLNIFKKLVPLKLMIIIEKILQTTISLLDLAPSVFFLARKSNPQEDPSNKEFTTLESILICPICKNDLIFTPGKALCSNCKQTYLQQNGIWDFRQS